MQCYTSNDIKKMKKGVIIKEKVWNWTKLNLRIVNRKAPYLEQIKNHFPHKNNMRIEILKYARGRKYKQCLRLKLWIAKSRVPNFKQFSATLFGQTERTFFRKQHFKSQCVIYRCMRQFRLYNLEGQKLLTHVTLTSVRSKCRMALTG